MNMITEIKNDVKGLLVTKCGVSADKVHYHAATELNDLHARSYPVVGLITGDETFENNSSGNVRGTRTIPLELRIWASDEAEAMTIAEKVLSNMPTSWQYKDYDGEIDIVSVAHSDHIANVTEYYACFITCNFTMQVHST